MRVGCGEVAVLNESIMLLTLDTITITTTTNTGVYREWSTVLDLYLDVGRDVRWTRAPWCERGRTHVSDELHVPVH